ncbi:NAD(P)/FAD-dependent oxidoreductase [Halorarius halobius]|uniref:NAD(P)/FAD-dependent oxidoreductase n=1 Tax=Halorarius halobius TaxID=2962671 RepID=UPI0020CF8DE1|nr:FAD-dependent oxidoreductase [Halorarius halobius]
MHVAVVGGGAVGVTVAHDLTEQDAEVTLFEADEVAAGASGRAAGLCYDAFSDERDAALGVRALERFRELSGGGSFSFEECPYVWLAREPRPGDDGRADERVATIREHVDRMRDHDLDVSLLTGADLAERFPGVVGRDVSVAAVAENAGYVDPEEYTRTMALMSRMAGADIVEDAPVGVTTDGTVETPDGERAFDAVVVAAGAHTPQVVADLAPIPVKPYRVQALTTEAADVDPPMLFDATNGFYLRPHGDGLLVGDGTEPVEQDPDDYDAEADEAFLTECAMYQEQALGWSWPTDRAWAGLCTATPDGDPLVGELADGVYVATGWQGHGLMRAPAIAERLVGQLLDDADPIPGFEPGRFDGDEQFEIVEGMDVERR